MKSLHVKGYTILSQISVSDFTIVYRAVADIDQRPVIIKVLRSEYPTPSELIQLRNQYAVTSTLSIAGIVHSLSLLPIQNSYALIMADCGSISLKDYKDKHPLALAEILDIAIQLANTLHALAQQRVIHKDIKPANIVIHPETKQVKLIDFSIASLLPRETQEIQNPNVLEGTLAYLAPEQTGRMNRGIDYRADFYALGVTLYELLSGTLPCTSEDPLELVHCHIAKLPTPVDRVNTAVPGMVAAIVSKLMAKNAEDRYQSAIGLKYDLQQCLTQWQTTGEILAFELGQRDVSDRFLIPEKLYGRAAEVQSLLDAFDRVAQGSSELMLVAGFSGIGKTAIINEVHKPIARQNGYFIKGKFDQFNRNIPFSAFVQAFRSLMAQLLSESDAQLQLWKSQILNAVGDSGQVLINVIPELERLIGSQPPATELSGTAAQNRFNLLSQKFLKVFTTPAHPLVLFLDDLQWADSASLNMIQVLMAESTTNYLLLLGAYRDNEVSAAHPLILTLDKVRQSGATVNKIDLHPLNQLDLNQSIADTLHCAEHLAQPLTELVMQKTQGNPFFATQFLRALHQDKLITFDPNIGYWQCDIVRAQAAAVTDNVVEFMALQLQKLQETTQTALKLAACIGAQFDLQTLAIVSEQSLTEVATSLWKALQEGLILPQGDAYKFYVGEAEVERLDISKLFSYKFLHDRIQQAAYSLIPADDRATIHARIGRLLFSHCSSTNQEERIFEIVGHLNAGSGLIVDPAERIDLAGLNLIAGRKAIGSTAYAAALAYLDRAISLLPGNTWTQHYTFTLELYNYRLDAAFLNTRFEDLVLVGEVVLQHATSVLDRVKVYETRLMALRSQGRFLEVVEIGLHVLQQLGIEFPPQPTPADITAAYERSRQVWQGRDPLSLLDLPTMQDPRLLAAMQILTKIVSSTHIAAPSLLPLLVFKELELSVQHGNSPISIFAYADYGLILCGIMDDLPTGYEFGKLSLALLEKLQFTPYKCRAYFIVNSFIRHWQEPLHSVIPSLLEGYRSGLDNGDWETMALNLSAYSHYQYWSGRELQGLAAEMGAYRQAIEQVKQTATLKSHEAYLQAVLNLLGQSQVPFHLQGTIFDADQSLPLFKAANDRVGLFHVYLNQAILSYLFEQNEQAIQLSPRLEEYSDGSVGFFLMPIWVFYDALIQLRSYPNAVSQQQATILERVAAHQDKLQGWATHAPCNHQHRWQLIAAETHRVLDRKSEAIEYYDQAISSAKANHFIQDQALANELAAKFYLDWGKEKVAASYLEAAYYCYAKWGAKAKTDHLAQRYPELLDPVFTHINPPTDISIEPSLSSSHPANLTINQSLDFGSILKASQSLSSTIDFKDLLHQLTQIILQNSGGDLCALVLPNSDDKWCLEALATPENTIVSDEIQGHKELPVKLMQYVKNSPMEIVVDNLNTDLPVIDEYLEREQPKSILCLPMFNQGVLMGILYLENRSTSHVFSRDRIEVLNLLCTQAAISLANARLYQASCHYNEELLRATRLKDEFLANMSHELRTPLNAILGMTEGLAGQVFGTVNERQLKALATIDRSGSHLLELINDILDLAKIESGHLELDCQPTSVALICRSSLTFVKQQAYVKRITLETKLPQHLPDLMVEERRIRQVAINLLNNAVKFTPEGGKITLEVENTRSGCLKISITDTGIGISADNIKKLFQPFVQIDGALNRKYQGTGLGLALVKRVVELHGGSVGLTSEVGVGSCFSIELPCVDATIGQIFRPEPITLAESFTAEIPTVTSPLILLAEDNEANISTISSYLAAKGYRLVLANNGQEAIDLVQSARPNLVLMDIQMPGMDGIEAMQEIRRDPQFAELPMIALTALAMTGDREKCFAAGASDYISKPIKLKNLAQTIQQLLATSNSEHNLN